MSSVARIHFLWILSVLSAADTEVSRTRICQTFAGNLVALMCASSPPNDDFNNATYVSVLTSDVTGSSWILPINFTNQTDTSSISYSCSSIAYVSCENQIYDCYYTERAYCPSHFPPILRFVKFKANGSNFGATTEIDEPSHGSQNTSASVWFKWLSSVNASMRLTTRGSSFDTAVAVYVAAPWDGVDITNVFGVANIETPNSKDTSDDVSPNELLYSEVSFIAQDGQTYYIAIGGYSGDQGLIQLEGSVEGWIYPNKLTRVAAPLFTLSRLGVPRDPSVPLQDRFTLVNITSPTPGSKIFFTTDGTAPSVIPSLQPSTGWLAQGTTLKFSSPFPMCSCLVRAIAVRSGLLDSPITTSPFYKLQALAPQIFPDGGTFDEWVLVSVSAAETVQPLPQLHDPEDPAAALRYTLNSSESVTVSSPAYTVPINLSISENGTVVRARSWVPGLAPSDESVSAPFTIRPRAAMPRIDLTGANCEGPAPASAGVSLPCTAVTAFAPDGSARLIEGANFVGSATLLAAPAAVGTTVEFRLRSRTGSSGRSTLQDWSPYTSPIGLGVGQYQAQFRAVSSTMATSAVVAVSLTVLQPILASSVGLWASSAVSAGEYVFYSFPLTGEHPDVTVQVRAIFGQTDILLSAVLPRPTLWKAQSGLWVSTSASGGGTQLTVSSLDLGQAERSDSLLFLAIHGASNLQSIFFFRVSIDTSPVLELDRFVQDSVALSSWKYYKFYLGTALTGQFLRLYFRAVLAPQSSLGIQLAVRRGSPPTSTNFDKSTTTSNAEGFFDLVADIGQSWSGQGSQEIMFIGVQGLVSLNGIKTFNYTLRVSSSAPGPTVLKTPICGTTRSFSEDCISAPQEILNGTEVSGSVLSQQWNFYSVHANYSFLALEFSISSGVTSNGAGYLSCLSLYLQRDELPSLSSYVSTASYDGLHDFVLSAKVTAGRRYYLGIYATCVTSEIYEYHLTTQIMRLQDPIGTLSGGVLFITTTYRFYYKVLSKDSYSFYTLNLAQYADLRILLAVQSGKTNIYVSTTNPFPTRAKAGVSWSSEITTSTRAICDVYSSSCNSNVLCSQWVADKTCSTNGGSEQDGTYVDIITQDPNFLLGTYYIGVYAVMDSVFGIAAYTDLTSTEIVLAHTYSQTVTTYSYEYFFVDLIDKYKTFEVVATNLDLELPNFMTLLIQRDRKPSATDNIFQSNDENSNGVIYFSVNFTFGVADKTGVFPGRYYILVHFYKPGYVGTIFNHKYTLTTGVDTHSRSKQNARPGISSATSTQATKVRENFWELSTLIVPGLPQIIAFQGFQWQYRRIFVTSASSKLAIQISPLSPPINLTVMVRRSLKPTAYSYLQSSNVADSNGVFSLSVLNPIRGSYYYIAIFLNENPSEEIRVSLVTSIDSYLNDSASIQSLVSYFVYFQNLSPLTYNFYAVSVPPGNPDITIIVTHLVGDTDILATIDEKYPTRSKFSDKKLGHGWWKSENFTGGGKKLVIRNFDEGYMSPATYYVSIFSIDISSFYLIVQIDNPPVNVELGAIVSGEVPITAFSNFRIVTERVMSTLYVLVRHRSQTTKGLAVYLKQGNAPTTLDYDSWSGSWVSGQNFNLQEGMYLVALQQPKPDQLYIAGVHGLDLGLIQANGRYSFTLQFLADSDIFSAIRTPIIPILADYNDAFPNPSTFTFLKPDLKIISNVSKNNWTYFALSVAEPTLVILNVTSLGNDSALRLFARAGIFPDYSLGSNTSSQRFNYDECGHSDPMQPSSSAQNDGASGCNYLKSASDSLVMLLTRRMTNSSNNRLYIGVCSSSMQMNVSDFRQVTNPVNRSNITNVSNYSFRTKPYSNLTVFTLLASRLGRMQQDHIILSSSGSFNGSLYFTSKLEIPAIFFNIMPPSSSLSAILLQVTSKFGAVDMFVSFNDRYPSALTYPNLRSEAVNENPQLYLSTDTKSIFASVWLAPMFKISNFTLRLWFLPRPLLLPSIDRVYQSYLGMTADSWNASHFEIPASIHRGKKIVATLIPLNPNCNNGICLSKQCCSSNPFGSFSILVKQGIPAISDNIGEYDTSLSVLAPNSVCAKYIPCAANTFQGIFPGSACESLCTLKSDGSREYSCCEMFQGYRVEWIAASTNKNLSESWFLTVKGLAKGTRFTDFFLLNISSADRSAENLKRLSPVDVPFLLQNKDSPMVCQSVSAVSDNFRGESSNSDSPKLETYEIHDFDVQGAVPYGSWAVYKYKAMSPGIVTVTLTQIFGGGQGLHLFLFRGKMLDYDTLSSLIHTYNDIKPPSSTKNSTMLRGIDTFAEFSPVKATNTQLPILSNITAGYPGALSDGIATLNTSLAAASDVWVAIYGASRLFSPCKFNFLIDYKGKQVTRKVQEITVNTIFDGVLMKDQELNMITNSILLGNDIGIRLIANATSEYGVCAFGSNDGVSCRRPRQLPAWNGLGDGYRLDYAGNSTCRGCQSFGSFELTGLRQQLEVSRPLGVFREMTIFDTIQVVSSECTNSDGTKLYNTPLSLPMFPFYTIVDQINSKTFAGTCIDFLVPIIVPTDTRILLFNETAQSPDECCAKCSVEASCSNWMFISASDSCWKCVDQNLTYSSILTRPIAGKNPIYYQRNTTIPNSSWWNAPDGKCTQVMASQGKCPPPQRILTRGPYCSLVPGGCCLLSNMTSATADLARKNAGSDIISGTVSKCISSNSGSLELEAFPDNLCNVSTVRWHAEAVAAEAAIDDRQIWKIMNVLPIQNSVCLVSNGSTCLLQSGPWYQRVIFLQAANEEGDTVCLGALNKQDSRTTSYSLQLVPCSLSISMNQPSVILSASFPTNVIAVWRLQSANATVLTSFQLQLSLSNISNTSLCTAISG